MRLLLAEDERELSNALTAILKHNHYSVDAVYDGETALDYLLAGSYDGAVLDIMMPGLDGLTVLRRACDKILRITIPEDLDYGGVFEDLFETYTTAHRLTRVKTTHLGSLFRLTYVITLRDTSKEKEFIDALRCRNGNLEISCSLPETEAEAL